MTLFLLWFGTYCISCVVQQTSGVKDLSSLVRYDDSSLGSKYHTRSTATPKYTLTQRLVYSEFASLCRAQLEFSFFFLTENTLNHLKSRKFQLVPLMIGGEIAKISSSWIDDSLSAWIGLLDGTRIRTLVNLLYLGIRDNHWNYVNFETLETHCN